MNIQSLDEVIRENLSHVVTETHLNIGKKTQGKVRDIYDLNDRLLLITTDRQSAFDRVLAAIPFKGQVLNQVSLFWFEKTKDILPNHLLEIPNKNSMLVKKCKVFPIEFIVRGYMTGSTSTSLWTHYSQGKRQYCGHHFPEGLQKNQKLSQPVLTPTTKDVQDKPISAKEIIQDGWMTASHWEKAASAALKLYQRGVELAAQNNLILVDTKYEMGLDENNEIILIDEIHTPDSSRYWLAQTYAERFNQGLEPENIDKEFLRKWFIENCDPYHDKILPKAPEALVIELSKRYIKLYEMITGHSFF